MSSLELLLVILGLALGLCNTIVYFVFVFSKRLSRKNYMRLAFVLAFLSSSFLWYATFFRDEWGTVDISVYAFFIVVFFIISAVVGGFSVLIGVYHEKLVSFSQSRLQKAMQKKAEREAERPVFYLTSTEVEPTLNPRKCKVLQELWSEERGEYFLRIQIEPPIKGGHLGVNQDEVDEFVVATRHDGTSLHPLSELPVWVYFCYILNDQIRATGKVSAKDLRILLIGQLYSSFEEAEEAIHSQTMRF